jgi:hypothetical protein
MQALKKTKKGVEAQKFGMWLRVVLIFLKA